MPWCAPAENKGGALGAKGVSGSRDVWVTSGVEKWEQTGWEGWSRVVTEERVYELCGARMREELRYPGYR